MRIAHQALAALFAAFLLSPAAAHAQKASSLTDNSIREFYRQSLEVLKRPYPEYLAFLQKSMTDDFVMANTTKLTLPGQKPLINTDKNTRQALIDNARTAYDSGRDAVVTSGVKNIELAKDGKSAEVIADTTVKHLSVPMPDGKMLLGDSTTECHDDVILSVEGAVQTSQSRCLTDMTISPGQAL